MSSCYETMTSRERVKAAINFCKPDRMPCNEAPWPDTIEQWHKQGLPDDVMPADYFGYDICSMFLDCSPRFEQKIIKKEGEYTIYQDRYGYTAKKILNKGSTLDFISHIIEDEPTWQRHMNRWEFSNDRTELARIDDASYFAHFAPYPSWEEAKKRYLKLYDTGRYMLFDNYGPWEACWRCRGYENQLIDTAVHSDWLKERVYAHHKLTIEVMLRCLEFGMKPDGYFMIEDLAANRGLLFSPASWRDIFKPAVKELGTFLADNNIDFWMHCCGNAEIIFDDLIECGLKVMQPLQVSAGLNVVELKKKYGTRLAFYGNISAPKMAGPLDELEEEIRSKVLIAKGGGYIFQSDHSVPPDVSFRRYKWIIETARHYADN